MAPKRSQNAIVSVENVPRPGHKRAKIEDPVGDKVSAIAEAMSDPQLVEIPGPASCRDMLVTTMPLALKIPRSERHSFQASVASMIGEILNSSKASWQQKLTDAQTALDSANCERSSAASIRDEANDQLKEQQVMVANCKEQVDQHAKAEKAAQQVADAAQKEVLDFEGGQAAKAKKLEERYAVFKDHFEAVQSPTTPLSTKDQKTHLSKLTSLLKELSADASLITAMQAVVKKMPAERGAFDSMALSQVETLLKENIDSLQSDIDNNDTAKAQKMEAQTQAQGGLDNAKETHKASQEAMKTATEALLAKQADTKAALKTLVSKGYEADNAAKHHAEQQKCLDKAISMVSMFTFLVERDVMVQPEKGAEETLKVMMEEEESPAVVETQSMQEVA